MQLRRITVSHTTPGDDGSTTRVELVADVANAQDASTADDDIARLKALATGRPAEDAPPANKPASAPARDASWPNRDQPEPAKPPPGEAPRQTTGGRQPEKRGSSQPAPVTVAVKLGSNGWRINCPIHGDHVANLLDARDGMPARIKCRGKTNGEYCKVGAPPPADAPQSAGGAR